jgi:hypothetical protein
MSIMSRKAASRDWFRSVGSAGPLAVAAILWGHGVQAAPPPGDDIVVNARAQPGWSETRHIVNEMAPAYDGQLARMDHALCAQVIGLAAPYDGLLARKIGESAATLTGMAVPQNCTPNLQIIFFDDIGQLVHSLRRDSSVFGSMKRPDIDRLVDGDGPVRAWRSISTRNEDGTTIRRVDRDNEYKPVANYVDQASYILLPTHQVIDWSVIVIDQKAAEGKSLSQLADFAAMTAVTAARPGSGTPDSILSLFDSGAPATGLTRFDRDYAAGLYRGNANVDRLRAIERISAKVMKSRSGKTSADTAPPAAR